ncbi:MAG: 2-oxo acid dehydrogenase subunit E2, partial [Proteobacteria bacterium]
WLIKPGDVVKEDQPMIEVMTDKATVTITSPKAGTIVETRGKIGDVVQVHSTLVVYDTNEEGPPAKAAPKQDDGPAATAVGDIKETLPGLGGSSPARAPAPQAAAPAADSGYFNEKPLATPATRKLARALELLDVTLGDVEQFQSAGASAAGSSSAQPVAPTGSAGSGGSTAKPQTTTTRDQVQIAPTTSGRRDASALEERVPFAGLRRKIAAKMQQSKQTAAHFTFVEECDVSALKDLRKRLGPHAQAAGVKLTFLPFIAKAVIAALKKHPILNSALDESTNELVYRKVIHLGIATSSDAGLVVPVVRDADSMSVLDLAKNIARLAEEVRAGKAKSEELSGSTFTITSLGAQGGLFATPILNFPEVGILGVHQIKQKPVVRDGQIVIGDVMLLSLSFDHRIVDGHVGAAFAYDIIGYLENPDRLFLEMG